MEARSVCLTCPVLDSCRAQARRQREYGFWGGESEEERAAAGYAVALPTGSVARRIQMLRHAERRRLSHDSAAVAAPNPRVS